MTRFATLVGCFVFILLKGCSLTTPSTKSTVTLDNLFIKNNTTVHMINVTLKVPKRGSNVSCSLILPGYDCSLGFPAIKFENNPATLSWSQNNHTYNKPLPKIKIFENQTNKNQKAIIIVSDDGELKFELE